MRLSPTAQRSYANLLAEHRPQPIHDEKENVRAITILEQLHEKPKLSPAEANLSELITVLIERFEDERYGLPDISPREILAELMAANGLQNKDLAEVVGSKGLASEILSGRREISKNVARLLGQRFHVRHTVFL